MKGSDIRIRAQIEIGTPIDIPYATIMIDSAVKDICGKYDTALQKETATRIVKEEMTEQELEDYVTDYVSGTAPKIVPKSKWIPMKNLEGTMDNDDPLRVVSIIKVENIDTKERTEDFRAEHNSYKIENPGTYTIEFLTMPSTFDNENDHPGIHELFQAAIPFYVGAREKTRLFGEQDPHVMRMMNEYYMIIEAAHRKLSKQARRRRKIAPRDPGSWY